MPERVDPLLELSFVKQEHIRTIAISMLFDLMLAEENCNTGTMRSRRDSVVKEVCPRVSECLISRLDYRRESIDASYKSDFEIK